ncbi:MAG: biopolymer transporter ExbD [Verrucomicrobiota bacterium]
MKLKMPKKDDVEIDMAPMIDMVFLLLIFFMVASVVVTEKVDVSLPDSQAAKVPEDIKGRIVLSVDVKGQIYLGPSRKLTLAELKALLSEELDIDPNLRILIRSDERVEYKTLKEIMVACGEVGATDLIYATFEE